MVNSVIRKYLRQYKSKVVSAETDVTIQLNRVFLDLEPTFHKFVQEISTSYDLDNDAVSKCIRNQRQKFNKLVLY